MGYRNYIAYLSKEEYDKIKNFTKEELFKYKNENIDDGHVGVYDIAKNTLHELGKYVDLDGEKFFTSVFKNKKLQKYFEEDHDFYVVKKSFLKHVIEHYTEKIKNYYTVLLTGVDWKTSTEITQKKAAEFYDHIRSTSSEWLQLTPYDLENGDQITHSWKFEYSIFELVRIYKTFDWKNNVMIYYGY